MQLVAICLAVCYLVAMCTKECLASCNDIDPLACQHMLKNNPLLCQDPALSTTACPRLCGNCPVECYECASSVRTFTDCNTIKTCTVGEQCMLRTLTSTKDSHHEYKMNCASVEMCDGSDLMVFGKRGVQTRDVITHCCSTNHCNYPQASQTTNSSTITTAPTTSLPSHAQTTATVKTTTAITTTITAQPIVQTSSSPTSGCSRDIEILVEDSQNQAAEPFIISFLKSLMSTMAFGPQENQFGLALFDSHIRQQFEFSSYSDQSDLLSALDNITFHHLTNSVDTQDVIRFINEDLRVGRDGDRGQFKDIVLLIADHSSRFGRNLDDVSSNINLHIFEEAGSLARLQARNDRDNRLHKEMIVINVGSSASNSVFSALTMAAYHEIKIADYSQLQGVLAQVIALLCQ